MAYMPHSPADLAKIYRNRFDHRGAYRLRVWQILAKYFALWIPKDAAVLDLGSGYCEFINQVQARTKYAMDLNLEGLSRVGPGIQILHQDSSESWKIASGSLDVVFTSNFLEHLTSKSHLERTLLEAYRCLKQGGRLIVLGPNIKYVHGQYWDFFDHYLPLTELSLSEALRNCGFLVPVCIDRFLPYTMSRGPEYPAWSLKIYLAWPGIWPFFGKQFLVVARKPEATALQTAKTLRLARAYPYSVEEECFPNDDREA
jgi:SAM-dependent methyltransferase